MVEITFSIPEDVHLKMRRHSDIQWSEVIRSIIKRRLELLDLADKQVESSLLSKKSVLEISKSIDEKVSKKLRLK